VRDEFLSIASHELRTPLTPLKVQTQLLKRLIDRGTLLEMPKNDLMMILETADREINRLSKLITNLLSVSRIVGGGNRPECERIDVPRLLRDMLARLDDDIKASGSEINLVIELNNPEAYWDTLQIEQVLTNLLTNALKYGRGKPIAVFATDLGERIKLKVADQGMGIAESELGVIFERFERTNAAKKYTGLGLGLYIARQLVLAHGGQVSVQSQLGQGSAFTVELPRRAG
jgi:signal transduction histidine kinase